MVEIRKLSIYPYFARRIVKSSGKPFQYNCLHLTNKSCEKSPHPETANIFVGRGSRKAGETFSHTAATKKDFVTQNRPRCKHPKIKQSRPTSVQYHVIKHPISNPRGNHDVRLSFPQSHRSLYKQQGAGARDPSAVASEATAGSCDCSIK